MRRPLALLALFALSACAETVTPPVTPPAAPSGADTKITGDTLDTARKTYYQSLENGTQRVRIRNDRVDTAAIYWATYESPALKSFRRDALSVYELWSPEQKASETTKDAAEDGQYVRFTVVLYTADAKDNIISKADDSVVKVYLLGKDGKRVAPADIHKFDSPRSKVAWLYPHKDAFSTVWELRFPHEGISGPVELQLTGTQFTSATQWDVVPGGSESAAPKAPPDAK